MYILATRVFQVQHNVEIMKMSMNIVCVCTCTWTSCNSLRARAHAICPLGYDHRSVRRKPHSTSQQLQLHCNRCRRGRRRRSQPQPMLSKPRKRLCLVAGCESFAVLALLAQAANVRQRSERAHETEHNQAPNRADQRSACRRLV